MNKILPQKSFYSFIKGKIWTTTLAMLMLFMAIGTSKAHAQDQILCGPATVSNLINTGPSGSTASWFSDASGGTALATSTALATGTYYVEQSVLLGTATLGSGFRGPTGIAVQADGKIIVADFQNNLVKRMNADGTGIVTLGSGFFQPINVAVEASGTILILEFGPSAVKRMSADGTVITTVASGFNNPGGVTVQSDGKILVANSGAGTIIRMDADGTNLVTLGSGFNFPYATAVQSDGKIVFADAANSLIKRMDANGGNVVTLGSGFNNPRRIAIQPDGKILVADFGNSSIKRMNADGTGIVTLGSGFGNTFGVALESIGKILVADFSNNAIKRITEAYTTTRAAVNVTINTTAVPTRDMSITGTLCNGATIGTLISKFNNSANIACYATETGGAALSVTDLIAPVSTSINFYLTQTINGCESARVLYNAVVNFITPPTAAANQSFCNGATVANLVATPGTSGGGNNAFITGWYTTSTGGSALPNSTVLINGNYYVGQIHISGCTLERTMVTVTINSGTLSAPLANSNQVYVGLGLISNLTASGNNLQWYNNITGGTALATTTILLDGTTYYVSQSSLCSESTRTAVTVRKISEASQSFCDIATVIDLVATPSAGNTVQWYSDAAGTMPIFGNTLLTSGTYYVSQQGPATVSTLAGSGTQGNANGTGINAQFSRPRGVVSDSQGNIFVADYQNSGIRKITTLGEVTTFATGFNQPHGITIDALDNLYIGDSGSSSIKKITPSGVVSIVAGDGNQGNTDGPSNIAQFSNPAGVKFDSSGNIYVADITNDRIRKIATNGVVSTLAGSTNGYIDAPGTAAQFSFPYDVTTDSFGNVYVADVNNNVIRKITTAGDVSTFAGSTLGYADGIGSTAQFNSPRGLAIDSSNNLYVMDAANRRVRKISPSGIVTTVAGISSSGATDGPSDIAQFGISFGLTVDANGIIYVADTNNNKIRKIIQAPAPSNIVAVTVNISPITESITTISACDSYTWVSNDSQTYNESGTYTGTTTNCVTEKLVLTITQSSDNITPITACDSYTWNGTTYNQTGIYIGATTNCVTEKLNLTITPSSITTTSATAVGIYSWTVTGGDYTASGLYNGTIANCVRQKLDLTIVPVTISVTQNNGVLTANTNATNVTYEWFVCDIPNNIIILIPNQTNSTFTPTASGIYSCRIIIGGNSEVAFRRTSECFNFNFLANNTFSGIAGIDLYPNPSNGIINMKLPKDLQIEIYNNLGQMLSSEKMLSGSNVINIADKPTGVYFLKANDGNNIGTFKIIKN